MTGLRALTLAIGLSLGAATLAAASIPLWSGGAPGTLKDMPPEVSESRPPAGEIVRNVSQPELIPFPADPKIATGTAVIVAPGGGFHMLSIANEGTEVAKWLNSIGITAFVLKYRLLPTGEHFQRDLIMKLMVPGALAKAVAPLRPLATADGMEAVRKVRAEAAQWKVAPDRIGLMGFSAGGAVTVWTILEHRAESRPDFAIAIYPGLLPDPLVVPKDAPPLFALVADDDRLAGPDSKRLAAAWAAAGVPSDLQTYPKGGHGFGIAKRGAETDGWPDRLAIWLKNRGLLAR